MASFRFKVTVPSSGTVSSCYYKLNSGANVPITPTPASGVETTFPMSPASGLNALFVSCLGSSGLTGTATRNFFVGSPKAEVKGATVTCAEKGKDVYVTCTVAVGNNTSPTDTCFAASYAGVDCDFDSPWDGLNVKFNCSTETLDYSTQDSCSDATLPKKTATCFVKPSCTKFGDDMTAQSHVVQCKGGYRFDDFREECVPRFSGCDYAELLRTGSYPISPYANFYCWLKAGQKTNNWDYNKTEAVTDIKPFPT